MVCENSLVAILPKIKYNMSYIVLFFVKG
jgi:hypothetical protein